MSTIAFVATRNFKDIRITNNLQVGKRKPLFTEKEERLKATKKSLRFHVKQFQTSLFQM